jgi:hypothetical protein
MKLLVNIEIYHMGNSFFIFNAAVFLSRIPLFSSATYLMADENISIIFVGHLDR